METVTLQRCRCECCDDGGWTDTNISVLYVSDDEGSCKGPGTSSRFHPVGSSPVNALSSGTTPALAWVLHRCEGLVLVLLTDSDPGVCGAEQQRHLVAPRLSAAGGAAAVGQRQQINNLLSGSCGANLA